MVMKNLLKNFGIGVLTFLALKEKQWDCLQ
jgi:hypothetical protein